MAKKIEIDTESVRRLAAKVQAASQAVDESHGANLLRDAEIASAKLLHSAAVDAAAARGDKLILTLPNRILEDLQPEVADRQWQAAWRTIADSLAADYLPANLHADKMLSTNDVGSVYVSDPQSWRLRAVRYAELLESLAGVAHTSRTQEKKAEIVSPPRQPHNPLAKKFIESNRDKQIEAAEIPELVRRKFPNESKASSRAIALAVNRYLKNLAVYESTLAHT